MKKLISASVSVCLIIVCSIALALLMSGCAKVTNTEYSTVEVKVIEERYRPMRMMPVRSGKVTTFITYPSRHQITVEYNGIEYTIDDQDTYNKYKERVGEYTNGTLETKYYDDGTIKNNIIALE